jgi:hypothetical protein
LLFGLFGKNIPANWEEYPAPGKPAPALWESEYACTPALSLILQNQFTTSMVMKKMEQEVKKLSAVIYVLIAILIAAVLTLITLILS